MAEAMYFERPVIATAYSGNLDFMTEENSYLVKHSMAKIGQDAGPYPAEAEWAEPDVDHAASLMSQVFAQPGDAVERGRRAAADIRRTHSPRAAGERIAARVAEVRRSQVLARFEAAAQDPSGAREEKARSAALVPAAPAEIVPEGDPASGRAQLHHLLRFGDPPPRLGAGRLRAFAKRLYMRLLRPYSSHQHRVNVSAATAIDELNTLLRQIEGQVGKTDEATRSHLDDELSAVRARLTPVENQFEAVDAEIRAVEMRLEAVEADALEVLELPAIVEKRTAALRKALDEVSAELADARIKSGAFESSASLRERERDERDAKARRELTGMDAELAATRERLDSLSSDIDATFDRDRSVVDGLRWSQESFAVDAEATLADLRKQADEAFEVVRALVAKPYMAENRFVPRDHPLFGSVLGYTADPQGKTGDGYRGFEDLFRGPEEMIRSRQETYLDLATGFAPVLDAGCGRGEFLDLLKEKGVEYEGVDFDPDMVARCREKGHEKIEQMDLLDYLQALDPDSLGTVFSAQVIEHLDLGQLQRLLELSLARLRPGGLFIAETVNPHSPAALKAFWVDPSHRQPLFPETMLALCQLAGYASADVFCPLGRGDWEADRLSEGEYAIVAVAPDRDA
jgi:SAM-dependent methyltransferase/predicted  nucleic acid-binding Zn-ribbon protein